MIDNKLSALQDAVGGPIEVLTFPGGAVVINEEGRLMGLPNNFKLKLPYAASEMIVGPALFLGVEDDEFCDVKREVEAFVMAKLKVKRKKKKATKTKGAKS